MPKFLQVAAWNSQREENFDAVINLELLTHVTSFQGRAVVHFAGTSLTMTQPYDDFVSMLDAPRQTRT